jgi:hypothetical protein
MHVMPRRRPALPVLVHFIPIRSSAMTKTAFLLALVVTALASMHAHAQPLRIFVSGGGLDTNPCTVTQPCRSFQQAYNTAAANGEIDVLDPAGYGLLTITHGISIQAHGWGGITQTASCPTCAAITISVTTSDPVTLNGLVLDGAGTGEFGIYITSAPSLEILNSVVRHFQFGIYDTTSTSGNILLIQDTIVSDNQTTGINILPNLGASVKATLSRITVNAHAFGVATSNNNDTTVANSVISNNSSVGLQNNTGVTWLAKNVISGNGTGVLAGGTVNSYGDNYIKDNMTPVSGSLTSVATQ